MERISLIIYAVGLLILLTLTYLYPYPQFSHQMDDGLYIIEGNIIERSEFEYGTLLTVNHTCQSDIWMYEEYIGSKIRAKIQKNGDLRVVGLLSPNQ